MVNTEPKLVPENFVGTVEIQMTQLVRNMCKMINVDIRHPNRGSDYRGVLKIYAEQSSKSKDFITFDLMFESLKRLKYSGFLGLG